VEDASPTKMLFFYGGLHFVSGVPAVDDDRKPQLLGKPELAAEGLALLLRRRKIIMKVEPDLPDSADFALCGQPPEKGQVAGAEVFSLVRMYARRRDHIRTAAPQAEDDFQALGACRVRRAKNSSDAYPGGTFQDIRPVLGKLIHVQMGMGVHVFRFFENPDLFPCGRPRYWRIFALIVRMGIAPLLRSFVRNSFWLKLSPLSFL
jgi:hypothetical protein